MATAKQIAWRRTFAARYGKKKGRSKAKAAARTSKGGTPMARRRRTLRSAPRRAYRAARSHVYHRRSGSFVVPWADALHGIYTLDGATDKRISAAGVNVIQGITGSGGGSFDNAIAHVGKGVEYATQNPQKAITGAVKNFATVYVVRKAMGFIGIPKTVKVTKKIRIQTGAL